MTFYEQQAHTYQKSVRLLFFAKLIFLLQVLKSVTKLDRISVTKC